MVNLGIEKNPYNLNSFLEINAYLLEIDFKVI